MEISDKDRADFLENHCFFHPLQLGSIITQCNEIYRPLDDFKFCPHCGRISYPMSRGINKNDAIDNAIMAMREKDK